MTELGVFMTVLFFCVEDVLNFPETEARSPDGRLGVVDKKVKELQSELTNLGPGAQLILYGEWAPDWNFDDSKCTAAGKYLNRKLERRGLHIMDKKDDLSHLEEYVQIKHIDNYKILSKEGQNIGN